jgi:hypothetical protein
MRLAFPVTVRGGLSVGSPLLVNRSPFSVSSRIAVIALAAGCASYADRTAGALRDFQGGQFERALEIYSDPAEVGSDFLSGAEAGTVAFTAGDWDAAIRHFDRAAAAVEDIEGRALAGPERLAEGLASWAINDATASYLGEGFERVYLHCFLAQAYLAKGKVDDVYVEVRRANQLLESEEKLYETTYEAGGWGHLISAVTYELIGQPDQAYLDYERMVAKGVGTSLAGKALVRLARKLGREEDLRRLESEYGGDANPPADSASVVVLAAIGLGPFKAEAVLPIPTPDGLFQMAVPGYVERPPLVTALRLVEDESQQSVRTDPVESVTQVAKKNLQDRLAWIAAKSVARGLLKRELTKKLEKEFEGAGRIAGDLFAFLTERADLRAWLTLPDSFQASRMFLAPGTHGFSLEAVGGVTLPLGTFEIEPGETMLVFARSLGTQLYSHIIGGRPVDGVTEALVSEVTSP